MFGEKCSKCGKRVSKKHEFCAYCGLNLSGKSDESDYGFLGKTDLDDFGIKLPFGFKAMLKPLMKEFNRQMIAFDREMRKQQTDKKVPERKNVRSFNISIGMPGQAPIKFNQGNVKPQVSQIQETSFPKISTKRLKEVKDLERKEPQTIVRRLGDSIIYELKLPNVNSLEDVNIAKLEKAIEVKAIGKDEVFVKVIDVSLPLRNYNFSEELLVLELGLK